MDKIQSPFKFLDSFGRKDGKAFFGREEEVEMLYQYVNKNRLVLVYGQSGAGKTSLVQCGLANRFDTTDWMPFFIRRGRNLNDALCLALSQSKALGGMEVNEENLLDALNRVTARYVRPAYLIFDQFEELLILGEEDEKKQFIETAGRILQSEKTQSVSMLFILREEYFAWLDEFEQVIPQFASRRLRVEPMRLSRIEEVILRSCETFNIKLEEGRRNAQMIIRNLSIKGGIPLPYLQVYLDMLWREGFWRTYPDGWAEKELPFLEFTTKEIEEFGAIKDVLERFLEERMDAIQKELTATFPDIGPAAVSRVLDAFVTEEGTKLPVYYYQKKGSIYMSGNAPAFLKTMPTGALTICLRALEQSRILRSDDDTFELAHDALAALIDRRRTDEQRRFNRLRRLIKSNYEIGQPLTPGHLAEIGDDVSKLVFSPELLGFVEESRKLREEERKREVRKERKMRRWASAFSVVLLFLLVWALVERKTAQNERDKARLNALVTKLWHEYNDSKNGIRTLQLIDSIFQIDPGQANARKIFFQLVYPHRERPNLPFEIPGPLPPIRRGLYSKFTPSGKFIIAPLDTVLQFLTTGGQVVRSFSGNGRRVNAFAISDDERYLAVSFDDNKTRVWDLNEGRKIILEGHRGRITFNDFHGAERLLLTASMDSTARLWDLENNSFLLLEGHSGPVIFASFLSGSNKIITASTDNTVGIWNKQGEHLEKIEGFEDGINSISLSSRQPHFVITAKDTAATVGDGNGDKIITLAGNQNPVIWSARYAPSGQQIITASADGKCDIYDADGNFVTSIDQHGAELRDARMSDDGRKVLTIGSDQKVKIWEKGQTEYSLLAEIPFSGEDWPRNAYFSPDGQQVLVTSENGKASLWSLKRFFTALPGHEELVRKVAVSPGGKFYATASRDKRVRLWSSDGQLARRLEGFESGVFSVAFSNDDKMLAAGSGNGKIIVWRFSEDSSLISEMISASAHDATVTSLAFNRDNSRLISTSKDGKTVAWPLNRDTGIMSITLEERPEEVVQAVFSPDGETLAISGTDGEIRIWETHYDENGGHFKPERKIKAHTGKITSTVFSQNGLWLLSVSADSTAKVWSKKGRLLGELSCGQAVNAGAFGREGKEVVLGTVDGTVLLWQRDKEEVARTEGHENRVQYAGFLEESQRFVTASIDGAIKIWTLNTVGREIQEYGALQAPTIIDMESNSEGNLLILGGYGYKAFVLPMTVRQIMQSAREYGFLKKEG